jgi:hypothetical protein
MNSSGRKAGVAGAVNGLVQRDAREEKKHSYEDTDTLIQGLTPEQIQILVQKVYDLMLDELRIEAERYGRLR